MTAPALIPQESAAKVDARRDRTHGYVIVLDPDAAEMEFRIRQGMRWAEAFFHLLLIAAVILGAACLGSQTMKWIGM